MSVLSIVEQMCQGIAGAHGMNGAGKMGWSSLWAKRARKCPISYVLTDPRHILPQCFLHFSLHCYHLIFELTSERSFFNKDNG